MNVKILKARWRVAKDPFFVLAHGKRDVLALIDEVERIHEEAERLELLSQVLLSFAEKGPKETVEYLVQTIRGSNRDAE